MSLRIKQRRGRYARSAEPLLQEGTSSYQRKNSAELRKLSPAEVLGYARKQGWSAAEVQSKLGDSEALNRWKKNHPEFDDPQVMLLLQKGDREAVLNFLQEISFSGRRR